jgi:hypothetical protein
MWNGLLQWLHVWFGAVRGCLSEQDREQNFAAGRQFGTVNGCAHSAHVLFRLIKSRRVDRYIIIQSTQPF